MLSSKTSRQKALLALAWVCFFWGTTWLASKEGVQHMPAIQLCAIRQLLGGSVYLIYFILTKHPWPKGKQWGTILILSVLNFMLSNGLSTWGVQYISSGLGAIIGAIFPLWLVLIALFGGDRLPQKAILGMVLGFGGVCIIFYDHLKDFLNADFTKGIILSVIATISWAFGSLYTKKHAANFNPYFSLGLQMLISSIALFSVSYTTGNTVSVAAIPANAWWAILYLVVIGSVLTFIAYIYSLQRLPTSLASLYAYINPMVAVLLGALIFHEKLNMYIAVGGAVTITGVYLVNDTFRKKTQPPL
ncbi:DMT family transporter [Ferruginibacter sp. SUN106]|uniref:DMT family transporter n=1 Tax=Ferruginibacter sp. SUN106 TaxID=2978348 RepID=UPI003D366433